MTSIIADALARKKTGRPQKTYLWRMRFPDLSSTQHVASSTSAIEKAKAKYLNNTNMRVDFDMRDINHRVMSVNAPFLNVNVESALHENSMWHYGTRNEITELTVELEDYEDALAFQYLQLWRSMIMNNDGTYNPPAFYKRNIDLFRMTSTKLDLMLHRYTGCFISAITDVASDYETTGILRYNVTLTIDDVESKTFANIEAQTTQAERALLRKRIQFGGDDPVNMRELLQGEPIDDAYNVFDNVISRVPGL